MQELQCPVSSANISKIPKKKLNYFIIYNKYDKEYEEIKYLNQHELAEGWQQNIPTNNKKMFINHFSITLAFLPSHLWSKLKTNYKKQRITNNPEESEMSQNMYKTIKDGLTRYSIIESNQDYLMINMYNELKKMYPSINLLKEWCEELDQSQHASWLVILAKNYIQKKYLYISEPVTTFNGI
jgi:hypothetical protein